MRLRKRLKSRSITQLGFLKEWASVYPRHPSNFWVRDYLAKLRKTTWPSVRTAKAKAGTPSPSTTATASKGPAPEGVLSKLKKSVLGALGRALFIASLIPLLASCASTPKVGPCVTLDCGLVCCNNDGKVCRHAEGCDGGTVRKSGGSAEEGVPR